MEIAKTQSYYVLRKLAQGSTKVHTSAHSVPSINSEQLTGVGDAGMRGSHELVHCTTKLMQAMCNG